MSTTYQTLEEATTALLTYAPSTRPKTYDLTVMKRLMTAIGSPETRLRVIHVAGTSGKTSTCYYLRSLLEASGQRVGLTVSPHITAINERVQIDEVPLAEDIFLRYFNNFIQLVRATDLTPSYYELTMAFAYFVFDKERVDFAVIETGLGGLLDGSNVAEREDKICVIQRIGYDHTEILGNTLPEIALQKAGIIHARNIVFLLEQSMEVDEVISKYAADNNATLYRVKETEDNEVPIAYQQANWTMAYAVYHYIAERDNLAPIALAELNNIKQLTPPGRYELYKYGAKNIILDGAHNGQKLAALMASMRSKNIISPTVIFSLKGTDNNKIDECFAAIAANCGDLFITSFMVGQDARHISNADLMTMVTSANKQGLSARVFADQRDALEAAMATENKNVLITGSLYLVSQMRQLL